MTPDPTPSNKKLTIILSTTLVDLDMFHSDTKLSDIEFQKQCFKKTLSLPIQHEPLPYEQHAK